MKFDNYKFLCAMSLLIISMNQINAAWRRPLTGAGSALGSAALSGYYSSNGQGATSQQGNTPVNLVAYPKSTDFSTYKSMTDGAYKFSLPKSTYEQNNKPKEPSKLAQATEKLEKFIVDQLKEELDAIKKEGSIEGLKWSQLTSEQQKLEYLRNELKDFKIVDDAFLPMNINAINNVILGLKDEVQANHFLDSYIQWFKLEARRNSGIVSMDIEKKFIDIQEFSFIDQILESIFLNPIIFKDVAYHEGAHALMMALVMQNRIAKNATNRLQIMNNSYGHLKSVYRDLNESKLQALVIDQKSFGALQALHLDAQNVIMMDFAGGIGVMIKEGRKVSFKEFLSLNCTGAGYGIGDRTHQGTDVYTAYKTAGSYVRWKNFSRISKYQDEPDIDEVEFQQEVDDFMEESYEKAYALLIKNRAKLDTMAHTLVEKRTIYMDEIYSIAEVPRPKFDSEFTFAEQFKQDLFNWFVWTAERIKFYEKQHLQA